MKKQKIFTEDQFVPTQWSSAADKAKFANHFVDFVKSNFSYAKFPQWFYNRLSMTFHQIAHFNKDGFYSTCFSTPERKIAFLLHVGNHYASGDPRYTFSDVERVLTAWANKYGIAIAYNEMDKAEMRKQS